MTMDERMTVCNMSIEGGARCGYINPDAVTYDYLKGRTYAPKLETWDRARAYWDSVKSDADAHYHEVVKVRAEDIEPMVTWGITPGQSVAVNGKIPSPEAFPADERESAEEAYKYMAMRPGQPIKGQKIDVAFIGSCTNGRLSDFEAVVEVLKDGKHKVAPHVQALVVPGSMQVKRDLVARGWDKIFTAAGFQFREAGCSMCLAMNPDKLKGSELSASSSNRNFKGRQGSPTGRTLLMSPIMVAAAAIAGEVADARQVFGIHG
jgi:3-isopropylmalate/(R)-2-methylmalate dehydratase large subunit